MPGQTRMAEMPSEWLEECRADRRKMVLLFKLKGKSDDEAYRRLIDWSIEVAREQGLDESDVETFAAQTRRDIEDALAEFRIPREGKHWKDDIIAALSLLDEA